MLCSQFLDDRGSPILDFELGELWDTTPTISTKMIKTSFLNPYYLFSYHGWWFINTVRTSTVLFICIICSVCYSSLVVTITIHLWVAGNTVSGSSFSCPSIQATGDHSEKQATVIKDVHKKTCWIYQAVNLLILDILFWVNLLQKFEKYE